MKIDWEREGLLFQMAHEIALPEQSTPRHLWVHGQLVIIGARALISIHIHTYMHTHIYDT